MKIKAEIVPGRAKDSWTLVVDGKPCVEDETFTVCDRVRDALKQLSDGHGPLGGDWHEANEVAANILKSLEEEPRDPAIPTDAELLKLRDVAYKFQDALHDFLDLVDESGHVYEWLQSRERSLQCGGGATEADVTRGRVSFRGSLARIPTGFSSLQEAMKVLTGAVSACQPTKSPYSEKGAES